MSQQTNKQTNKWNSQRLYLGRYKAGGGGGGGCFLCSGAFLFHFGSKRPLRSVNLAVKPVLPSLPLNHIPKHHRYVSFKQSPGTVITLLPWAACSNAWLPFQRIIFSLISSLKLSWHILKLTSLILSPFNWKLRLCPTWLGSPFRSL